MNHARRDLCGGCAARRIPTAIGLDGLANTYCQLMLLSNRFVQCELHGFVRKRNDCANVRLRNARWAYLALPPTPNNFRQADFPVLIRCR